MKKIYIVKGLEYTSGDEYKHAVNYKTFTTKEKAESRLTQELDEKEREGCYRH